MHTIVCNMRAPSCRYGLQYEVCKLTRRSFLAEREVALERSLKFQCDDTLRLWLELARERERRVENGRDG